MLSNRPHSAHCLRELKGGASPGRSDSEGTTSEKQCRVLPVSFRFRVKCNSEKWVSSSV